MIHVYRTVGIHLFTQQRERMAVDPVNQYPETLITVVRAPDDGCQHPKHVELPTEM